MTTASSQITSVSFRGVQFLALNTLGIPAASSVSEYAGVRVVGAKALTITRPEWQRITATGDDRILAQFILPPQEGTSGQLRVGAFDMIAEALISGLTVKTVGELKLLPAATDRRTLTNILVLGWREAKSVALNDEGRAHYEFVLIPSAELTPMGGEWGERATEERMYALIANVVGKWPWGEDLDEETDGHEEMQLAEGSCEYIPRISAFAGDGAQLTFAFGVDAVSTDKVSVWLYDGTTATDITEAAYLTIAEDGLTFTDTNEPDEGEYLIVIMEVAE